MLLDGVTLVAPPQFTWFVRGSLPNHPNAIDFGWNGDGTQNQPLYCGIYGAERIWLARKRYDASDIGHTVDIGFDTPNHTCFISIMHMVRESHLITGTQLDSWKSIVGYMGTTGNSSGEHAHIILAICPKGTGVDQMYNYRVEPDPYYHYVNDWHEADDKLPWVTLGDTPEPPSSSTEKITLDLGHLEVNMKQGQTYKVTSVSGNKVEMELQGSTHPESLIGTKQTIKGGSTLYDRNGNAYAYPTTQDHTVTINDQNGSLLGFSASWLVGVNQAYFKK